MIMQGGDEVWLLDVNRAHIEKLQTDGLDMTLLDCRTDETVKTNVKVNAALTAGEIGVCDVVIVLTKGPAVESAILSSKPLFGDNTFVLSMQNGLGSEDILLKYFPPEKVGRGVITIQSTLQVPGVINARIGEDPIQFRFCAMKGGEPVALKTLREHLNTTPYRALYAEDLMKIIWDKALHNIPTSVVCGLVDVPADVIAGQEAGRQLYRDILTEALLVANACGMNYNIEEEIDRFINVQALKMKKFSSAARDMFAHRETEIEFINGAVGKLGRKNGIPTPVNDTIANLVRVYQQTYAIQETLDKFA